MLKLVSVYDPQGGPRSGAIELLFELLGERKPEQSISHKAMPTFNAHAEFVKAKPYAAWYLIMKEDDCVGAIYLTNRREVGLWVFEKYQRSGCARYALNELCKMHPGAVYANISPLNAISQAFFTKQGFELCQLTYKAK